MHLGIFEIVIIAMAIFFFILPTGLLYHAMYKKSKQHKQKEERR